MTDATARDPRRRNLIVLGAIAAVALLLALLAVWRESDGGDELKQRELFPGLAARVAKHEAARIHIESRDHGSFDVVFRPQSGWVVASRGNYPASFEQVNATLVGLAAMQIIEPKTSKAEWLHFVGLDSPPKGDGVLVRVSNEKGETLAALIAGKTTAIGDAAGATGLFVRKPGTEQSWLVRSVSEIRASPSDWMEKSVMSIDRSRIRRAAMTPPSGPAYAVSRAKPSDPDFTLTPIPAGREVSDATAPNAIAEAVVGFSFDDTRPEQGLDLSQGSAKLVAETFDGLTVTVTTIKKGEEYWATVSATALPQNATVAREARDINSRAHGWAYKLAQYKGAQFTMPLENLLKPKGAPATTAP